MDTIENLRINYDVTSRRVEVRCGERRVIVPGTHDTLDAARVAAEAYARRYLGMK